MVAEQWCRRGDALLLHWFEGCRGEPAARKGVVSTRTAAREEGCLTLQDSGSGCSGQETQSTDSGVRRRNVSIQGGAGESPLEREVLSAQRNYVGNVFLVRERERSRQSNPSQDKGLHLEETSKDCCPEIFVSHIEQYCLTLVN